MRQKRDKSKPTYSPDEIQFGRPKGTNWYSTESIIEESKRIIEAHPEIVFITDLFGYLQMAQGTFYKYVEPDSEAYKEIMEVITANRIAMKRKIRTKLIDMNNPTAMIVLYKLIGDKDERAALSNSRSSYTDEPVNANIELKFS